MVELRIQPWVKGCADEILDSLPGGREIYLAAAKRFLEEMNKPPHQTGDLKR